MKTNQIMIRKMGEFNVLQRTSDGMFNASSLLDQWNKKSNTIYPKKIHEFLRIEATKEFIDVLKMDIHQNSYVVDNQVRDKNPQPNNQVVSIPGIIHKTNAKTDKKGKRTPAEIHFHPYLYIDFAMWLNPKFKLDVIKFVYDQLIENRHLAGDNYRGLASAVARFDKVDFVRIAKGLNYIIFGTHDKNLRQRATEQQLASLTKLQQQLAFAVDMGYIKTCDELINEMRRIYHTKNTYLAK